MFPDIKMQTETELLFASAFNETLDALIITDGSTGKIVKVNKSCCSLFGYTEQELIGNHLNTFFAERSAVNLEVSPQNVNMFGDVLINRILKTKSSGYIPVDMTINTFDNKLSNYVMTTLRDARERLKYEAELIRKNKELNESNISKDKLFSIIAHDLKNPLMALMGLSELMIEDHKEVSDKEVGEMFNTINRLSKETYDLLDNLLNWAQVQTKKLQIDPIEFNLFEMVDRVLNMLNPSAELKKIKLINAVPSDYRLRADENMIKTIIRNLVSNSIKFSFADSSITVKAFIFENMNSIVIEDHGLGMDKNISANLFTPGFIFSQPGTNNEKGTGLGLMLCYEFVKLHDGKINVISEPGKGSQFIVRLPK
jgi:PAS domain S-box-containing protein